MAVDAVLEYLQEYFLLCTGHFGIALVEGICHHAKKSPVITAVEWLGVIDQASQVSSALLLSSEVNLLLQHRRTVRGGCKSETVKACSFFNSR